MRSYTAMLFAKHGMRLFASAIRDLSQELAEMSGLAENHAARVIDALVNGDPQIAREALDGDAALHSVQRSIDERVVALIAKRRPAAAGLQDVLGISGIASELACIGDLAKDIGKRIQTMNGDDLAGCSTLALRPMASAVLTQLRDVIDSLTRRDVEKALDVWAGDQEVDRLCALLSRELVGRMTRDPAAITCGIHLLFCAKNLERIGDHATNIAEIIYHMVKGQRLSAERPKGDAISLLAS